MDKKNLIITSIDGWSNERWLEYRKPMFHVKQFIFDITGVEPAEYLKPGEYNYIFLKAFFETDQWREFIFPCIGASEIGLYMISNKYKSRTELYYEKVGILNRPHEDNDAMFWGRELEEQVAEKWQYWDGSKEGMRINYMAGKIQRKCRRMKAYIRNKACPWLFVSLDRVINKIGTKKEGSLECKNMSGYSAGMWESGLPPFHIIQGQAQILGSLLDYNELAILIDGRNMEVYPFEREEGIVNAIYEESKDFFERVKIGIQHFILSLVCPDEKQSKLHLHFVDAKAPEIGNSVADENYLAERYIDLGGEKIGTSVELQLAKQYDSVKKEILLLEEKKRGFANKLKVEMQGRSTLSFRGTQSKVTWRKTSAGNRVLKVSIDESLF
jgi:predicted phage-related endonuclease